MNAMNTSNIYTMFVYGTLKKGFRNNTLLQDSIYLGTGTTFNYALKYSNNLSGFPIMFKRKNNVVHGELYAVDEDTLKQLDILEDEGGLYNRKKVKVNTGTETIPAYSYIGNRLMWDLKKLKDVGKKEHNWNG